MTTDVRKSLRDLSRRQLLTHAAALPVLAQVVAPAVITSAFAQSDYPSRPIKIVTNLPPTPVGPDFIARLVADVWGKTFVVEQMAGAAGNIGAGRVAKSTPDGYTLLISFNSAIVVNPFLYKHLAHDPLKDLIPVIKLGSWPSVLVVTRSVSARNVAELVEQARAAPGKLNYASTGLGSNNFLAAELLKLRAGVDIQNIPYRGNPAAVPDMISGRVSMSFLTMLSGLTLSRDGIVRPIGVTADKRSAHLPDVPTMAEAGFPDFFLTNWYGLFAPAGTPPEIVTTLNREFARVLREPEHRKKMEDLGYDVVANTPDEFAAEIKEELPRYEKLIKELGLKPLG